MGYVKGSLVAATILAAGLLGGSPARADLNSQFVGFQSVNEVGVSGAQSSYYLPTQSGNLCPSTMPTLGTSPVVYPDGVGAVPSPGYYNASEAAAFDEGMLGVKVVGSNLVVRLATGINPQAGFYDGGWATQYGQGDMFVSVKNGANVTQFALLNDWARTSAGGMATLGGGYFGAAQSFHDGREGDLVQLRDSHDVTSTGGSGAYSQSYYPPPEGLDYRAFVNGGNDLGTANLTIDTVTDTGFNGLPVTWYVETWTFNASSLSASNSFDMALHSTFSCGNDQIGLEMPVSIQSQEPGNPVPAPGAVVLGMIGLGTVGYFRRRKA